jgi:dihydrofolate reductase
LRELTADLFISLDGFASGVKESAFFGYFGEELGRWVDDHLREPQILIMGRVTYEVLAQFSSSGTDQASTGMSALPKLVFSRTLTTPLNWKNSRLAKSPLVDEITALKGHPGEPLRTIGSINLVRNLMLFGLVDKLRLMVFPVILGGAGREPIYAGYSRTGLELITTKVLDSRLILLEYRPAKNAASV